MPEPNSGCWLWLGSITSGPRGGYGQIRWNGAVRYAHRVSYETIATVPGGLQLDHRCRNRACANPLHLEPVTGAVNTQRGLAGDLVTHCPRGHELTDENTIRDPRRRCRTCHNALAAECMSRSRA